MLKLKRPAIAPLYKIRGFDHGKLKVIITCRYFEVVG